MPHINISCLYIKSISLFVYLFCHVETSQTVGSMGACLVPFENPTREGCTAWFPNLWTRDERVFKLKLFMALKIMTIWIRCIL